LLEFSPFPKERCDHHNATLLNRRATDWFKREELPALKLAEDTLDVIHKGFGKVTVTL
jgi:hypothetical protein